MPWFGPLRSGAAQQQAGAAALTITADAGSYTLTGTNAGLLHAWKLDATTAATYSLTGTDATARLGRAVDATIAGSYALTGTDVATTHGWKLDATVAGSYALTGSDAATSHQWKLDATTAGSYSLLGTDATLTKSTAGAFTITADAGSYALVGTDATLTKTVLNAYVIAADSGAYLLTGTAAALTAGSNNKVIAADAGSYVLTGMPVTLISSAQPVLPTRGEWPEERKRRRKRQDARQEAVVAARAARDALKASLERLYDGGEYDAPVEVLEEAQTEALAVVNALTRLPDVPVVQLQAAEKLIRNIQEMLRQRQLDEAQTDVATAIARQHLVDTIDIAGLLYQRTRYNYLARVALLTAE